jgi:hypothetical protein
MIPQIVPFVLSRHAKGILCSISACLYAVANGQTVSPQAERDRIIKSAFTHCPGTPKDTYYFGFVPLPILYCGEFSRGRAPSQHPDCLGLMEFEDANFTIYPPPDPKNKLGGLSLTAADLQNGIRWKGYLALRYATFRERHTYGGKWTQWTKAQGMPAGTQDPNRLLYEYFWNESGKWSGEAGPDILKNTLLSAVAGRPRLEIMLRGRPSCDDIVNPDAHQASAQDRRPPLESISLRDRQFDGTVEEFAAALPGYFQRAAQAIAVNPVDFKKDTEFVVATIKKCAQLTAPFAPGADEGCYGFGTQERFRKYDKVADRALVIFMDGIPDRLQKRDSRPFTARVQFTALDSDQTNWDWGPKVNFGRMFGAYGIVSAKIR